MSQIEHVRTTLQDEINQESEHPHLIVIHSGTNDLTTTTPIDDFISDMNRRLQDICILMYRVRNRLCPTYICNIFNNHNSSYSLRQSDFSTPSFNTVTYGKHSLRYLGPKLWGKLSPDIRSAKTLNIFRKQIRKYDISLLIDDGCKGCSLCSS